MHPLVEKLEKRLLPEFEAVAEKIRHEIVDIDVRIYSSSVGSATQYQGHGFYIECSFLENVPDDEPDHVVLDVGLGHLTTVPKIMADVGWGNPGGEGGASFRDWSGLFPTDGIIVSDEVLEDLYKDLPRLYESLFELLRQRKPHRK